MINSGGIIVTMGIIFLNLAVGCKSNPIDNSLKINSNVNSGNLEVVVLQSQQYYFIPLGSFLQYSLNSW